MKSRRFFLSATLFAMGCVSTAFSAPVLAPDNGTGTVDFPVADHPYTNADHARGSFNNGPSAVQIELVALSLTGPPIVVNGGSFPGGTRHTSNGDAEITLKASDGSTHSRTIPVQMVVDRGPLNPTGLQSFDTEMFLLSGQLPPGDPDFDLLRVTAGSSFGLPSPGHTTLTRLGPPPSEFAVDSFFDITYRIEFSGNPAGTLGGLSGDQTRTDTCQQPLRVFNGLLYDDFGGGTTVQTPEGLLAINTVTIGDAELISNNFEEIKVTYDELKPRPGVPNPGDEFNLEATLAVVGRDPTLISIAAACTGGPDDALCVPDVSELGATECRVALYHQGRLLDSVGVPNATLGFSCAASDFQLLGYACKKQDDDCDLGADDFPSSLRLYFDPNNPILLTLPGHTPVLASEVRIVPADPRVRVAGVREIVQTCTVPVVIDALSIRSFGHELSGLEDAVYRGYSPVAFPVSGSSGADLLRVSNLGSSGLDGVCVKLPPPPKSHRVLPLEIDVLAWSWGVTPDQAGGGGGGVIRLRALDAFGNAQGECRLGNPGGAGGGGRVCLADFSALGASTARVRVSLDGAVVGEADVPLGPGETQVATLDDGPDGTPFVTGCGKNFGIPPWQFPCFATEFDRVVSITPNGTTLALLGDRIEILAIDAASGLDPVGFFEIFPDGPEPLVLTGIRSDATCLPKPHWTLGTPVITPSVCYLGRTPAVLDTTPGGLPPGSEGLQFRFQLCNLVEIGPGPIGGIDYACDLQIAVSGFGTKNGYDYYRSASGTCTIQEGPNPFAGQDVQEFDIELLSLDVQLPPGDPDFDLLRVTAGNGFGLPSPGHTTLTRLPGGDFVVDSFFDITYRIDFQGAPGGPLSGVTSGPTPPPQSDVWEMYQPTNLHWGLAHAALGQCVVAPSPTTDGLVISNIGSSGNDGVRVDMAGAEGGVLAWEPHPMLPGGLIVTTTYGDAPGCPVGKPLMHVGMQRHPVNPFFDITYDVSGFGGTECRIIVLSNSLIVGELPLPSTSGQVRVDPLDPTGPLPQLVSKALYGDSKGSASYVGPCDASVFDSECIFTVAGLPPLQGNQIRVCAPDGTLLALDRLECRMANDGPWTLESSSVVMHGRHVQGTGTGRLYCWGGECSVSSLGCPGGMVYCPGGGCAISPLACFGFPTNALHGMIISPRDAASGLPTGKRQHSPLVIHVDNPGLSSPADSLRLSMDGAVDGTADTPIGVLDVTHGGGSVFLTSVQWPYRLSNDTRVQIFALPLHQEPGNAARTPLYDGPMTAPLSFAAAKGDLHKAYSCDPGDSSTPPSISLSFSKATVFTTPDGGSVTGCTLTFLPDGPTPEVVELQSAREEGGRHTPFHNKRVTTGPLWATGVAHSTTGACDMETDGGGWTRVSNIGSSGQDGVSLDLRRGEGGHLECTPCPVTDPDASLTVSARRPANEGFFDIAVNFEDIFVTSNNDGSTCRIRKNADIGSHRVLCRDDNGVIVADLVLSTEDIGECGPAPGSGPVAVSAFGFQPQEITAAGRTNPGLYLHFAEPVSFTPASGGAAVACQSIEVHCPDGFCVQYRESDFELVCRLARLPDLCILSSSLHQFRNTPHTGLGAAHLQAGAAPDTLVVSNIGSSGEDGVRIDVGEQSSISTGGSGGEDVLTENVSLNFAPVPLELNVPGGGGGGRIALHTTGSFLPPTQPPVPLGECSIDTESGTDSVPMRCDFSDFGTSSARVVVLQDGVVVGQFVHGDPDRPFIVGRVHQSGPVPPALSGCGKLRSLPIPGGWGPPCFYFTFASQVEIRPPGAPGPGLLGNECRILAEGAASPPVAGLYAFELKVTSVPSLTITGLPRKDMVQWLTSNFNATEIDTLLAEQFLGDLDGDGINDGEEFARGTNVRVPESGVARRDNLASWGTGGDGLPHFRYRYVLGDVEGVEVLLRTTQTLQDWDDSPGQFDLVEVNPLPTGGTEYIWQRTIPISDRSHELSGHVVFYK